MYKQYDPVKKKEVEKAKASFNLRLDKWIWGLEIDGKGVVKLAAKDENNDLRFNYKR